MVDFFLLVALTGAGDELQGMKKGVMEIADAILINKADGDNRQKAEMVRVDYERMIHYLRPATEGWLTRACTCSAYSGYGIDAVWDMIAEFCAKTKASEVFFRRRQKQTLDWVYALVEEHLRAVFYQNEQVKSCRPKLEQEILAGRMPATLAAQQLIAAFEQQKIE